MGFRSSYWKTRLALTGPESVETLRAMQGYFRGGAKWIQGVYHAADGQKCLVGAADHLRASSVDNAKFWLEQAISEKLGRRSSIESFNDSRRSYREIAEVVARARQLAVEYHAQQAPTRQALTYQPEEDQSPVIEVTVADLERVALLSRRQRKPSNQHD